ncbi:hypothetical protein V6N13_114344 [Hibiscus sabdariffa]
MAVLGCKVRPTPLCTLLGRVGAGNWAQLEWINRDKPELGVGLGQSIGLLLTRFKGSGGRFRPAMSPLWRYGEGVNGRVDIWGKV